MMDAGKITAIRTAAVSGVATRLLAAANAENLAILGSGVQAETHLEAMRVDAISNTSGSGAAILTTHGSLWVRRRRAAPST